VTDSDDDLRQLLEFLKRSRGFDFTGYKRSSLERRFRKRMEVVEVESFGDYLDYLEVHPDEFADLFNTILINVTGFFRDAPAWKYVDEQVLPKLLADIGDEREIRIWSAGCASGEEAYSIAMLLVGHLGEAAFRDRVKIYATDVDEDALNTARAAQYTPKDVAAIPEELLDRCFERTNQHFAFRKDLRRSLIFGRNDLVQDAPISRIDLLLCRNVLMYFTAETQARMLGRFNFALSEHGYLFLGKSEMLLTHGDLFRPVDLKCRVFSKVPRPALRDRLAFVTNGDDTPAEGPYTRVRDGAFDLAPVAQVVIDRGGLVVAANQHARGLFGLVTNDVGRPLQDLEISYRPIELRAAIEQAYAERRAIGLGTVLWSPSSGDQRRLDVSVTPVLSESGALLGSSVTFHDVTRHVELRDELERSKRELEIAYEELQSTVEELETTNEELQSTNEELETTNEELQSTNEELETMNEELQSTNEELEAINDELRERSLELNEVNGFLEAILTSLGVGVVVVDRTQTIQIWNRHAEGLWGLRSEEAVGEHFLALDIGLPVDRLRVALRNAVAGDPGDGPLVVDATSRLGRMIKCAVTVVPLAKDGAPAGAIMLMEERSAED
jgi:two-component system, chemotaxis family, CheB/CheR fusion protein